ncbi:gastrula zinc finger protein XlCGF28.1-like [Silurus meridionalis]|nr:gastrula zinc finger protein XlCGF28.1-like [Silurus meridionalis]
MVKNTKFLGVHLANNLILSLNTSSIAKKAQQHLYFLRRLRKAHLPPPIISYHKTLQRIVRTAEKIIRVSLSSIMDIYTTPCSK